MPEQMGAFVAAVEGLADAANALDVPFVSGNVSLYNRSSSGNHVAPSPIVACIGTIADVSRTATAAFKRAGSAIYVLGVPQLAYGGSVFAEVARMRTSTLPEVDYEGFTHLCAAVRQGFHDGIVLAARDVSDGGVLTAIAEMAFGSVDERRIGVELWHTDDFHRDFDERANLWTNNAVWFAEFPGFVCEVAAEAADAFERLTTAHAIRAWHVGDTVGETTLTYNAHQTASLADLREAWEAPLRDFYGASAGSA
jgi:phosphoribosylformylglycinamidine synthase